MPITVRPTKADIAIACDGLAKDDATERVTSIMTWAADSD